MFRSDFKDLFIFDLANNHQGDLEFGKKIIHEYINLIKETGINGCIKFQFRDLDTFINEKYINSNHKYVNRFLGTNFSDHDFLSLIEILKSNNIKTISTPFDEKSVDKIIEMGIDIIKIGSCSALDWRLLDKIILTGKPIIVSTGGLNTNEIEEVIKYLESNGVNFALLHCVSLYPTKDTELELNQIEILKNKYPNIEIGFSTHENPDNYDSIKIAYSKGARIFEKHISIKNDLYKINDYSIIPEQAFKWINSWEETKKMCGSDSEIPVNLLNKQIIGLNELKRGIIASSHIKKGEKLTTNNTNLKFPLEHGQLSAFDWNNNIVADKIYEIGESISIKSLNTEGNHEALIDKIITDFKTNIKKINFTLPRNSQIYLSFHYGIESFYKNGCIQIYVFQNEFYSKKMLFLFPGQNNPIHFHKNKTETFFVIKGSIKVYNDDIYTILSEGDYMELRPGDNHGFVSRGITLIEEVSTPDRGNDSFYIDEKISKNNKRKVLVTNLL